MTCHVMMLSTRAEFRGEAVYEGLSAKDRAYSMGWSAGYDDGVEELPRDSTLAVEASWYALGYRDGYGLARQLAVDPDEATTLVGIGAVVDGLPLGV